MAETYFHFNIGDMVIQRVGMEESMLAGRMGHITSPTVFLVTGRYYDECPGGIQKHYAISRNGQASKVHEMELMLLRNFDVATLGSLHDEVRRAEREGEPPRLDRGANP